MYCKQIGHVRTTHWAASELEPAMYYGPSSNSTSAPRERLFCRAQGKFNSPENCPKEGATEALPKNQEIRKDSHSLSMWGKRVGTNWNDKRSINPAHLLVAVLCYFFPSEWPQLPMSGVASSSGTYIRQPGPPNPTRQLSIMQPSAGGSCESSQALPGRSDWPNSFHCVRHGQYSPANEKRTGGPRFEKDVWIFVPFPKEEYVAGKTSISGWREARDAAIWETFHCKSERCFCSHGIPFLLQIVRTAPVLEGCLLIRGRFGWLVHLNKFTTTRQSFCLWRGSILSSI